MITSPPKKAPYPVAEYLKLDAKATALRVLNGCKSGSDSKCEIDVRVGIFFDGTNNNLARDKFGERISLPQTARGSSEKMKSRMQPSEYSHSNVARLFQAFKDTSQVTGL